MTASPFQSLGAVIELLELGDQPIFAYPEAASITALLSDGTSERNAVIQGSGLTLRQAVVAWQTVPEEDVKTIRGYASTKEEVTFTEEDGTERPVRVFDFSASKGHANLWTVHARLVETGDPSLEGS